MFSKHKGIVPTGYAATRFLLTYFIVGLLILLLAFVYYTRQILQLNQDLEQQVGPLADLAAVIPAVKEKELSNRLTQIVKELLAASRLSFIITDATDRRVVIARGIDEAIEQKINAEPSIPLSPAERPKLQAVLARMEEKNKPRRIQYSFEDRELYAYFYHGDADETAIDRIPFVITDLNRKPQQWRIWEEALVIAEYATSDQYKKAEMLVRNSKALGREIPLQTTPIGFTRKSLIRFPNTSLTN